MGKDPVKHSNTLVSSIGNGSNVGQRTLIITRAGDRSLDGGNTTYGDSATTSTTIMVSDIVKYVNLVFQAAITAEGNDGNTQTQGWLEWAIVWRNEVSIPIPSTNLGTRTLQDIAMQMFRGDCLMTGQFPVSVNLPNIETVMLKLPKKSVKWKIGDELVLYTSFRDADTTNLETDTVKLVQFHFFKSYS